MVGGFGLEEREELVLGGPRGAGGDQAEHHVDGEGREDEVGVLGPGQEELLGEGEGGIGLVGDGFSQVHFLAAGCEREKKHALLRALVVRRLGQGKKVIPGWCYRISICFPFKAEENLFWQFRSY